MRIYISLLLEKVLVKFVLFVVYLKFRNQIREFKDNDKFYTVKKTL